MGQNTPFPYYYRRLANANARCEELEEQLEDVENGKGYISEDTHKEEMKELLEEQQEIIREKGYENGRLRDKMKFMEGKIDSKVARLEDEIRILKHTITMSQKE